MAGVLSGGSQHRRSFRHDMLLLQALFEAVDLASFEPPLMKKAAIRQLALIQAGMPKKEAIRTVEEDMRSKG